MPVRHEHRVPISRCPDAALGHAGATFVLGHDLRGLFLMQRTGLSARANFTPRARTDQRSSLATAMPDRSAMTMARNGLSSI